MDTLQVEDDENSVADTEDCVESVINVEAVDQAPKKRKRSEWEKINLRFKKLATVSLFVQIMNEVDEDWRNDQNLVRRTVEWTKRAATD